MRDREEAKSQVVRFPVMHLHLSRYLTSIAFAPLLYSWAEKYNNGPCNDTWV
jgi:hypothetical protein